MSDRELNPVSPEPNDPPETPARGARSRLRRFFLRHLPLSVAVAAVLLVLTAVAVYFVASSAAFENLVRKRLIAQIENATGGQTQIASFHWRLLHLEAEADGVVIHGTEDPIEAPYAQIDRLRVQISILGFFTPHILLRDLEAGRPMLHLIVYPDGSTNQPRPRRPEKRGKSAIDTLFDLRASHIAVEQGMLDYDNRAAAFDAQNRYLPLDFKADDVSLQLNYVPAAFGAPERYRIDGAATDLVLTRDLPRKQTPPVHGKLQLALDLERNRVTLRSLQLTAHSRGAEDRTLEVTGVLDDFTHPRWQAKAEGDLDMRLLDPVTGYPDSPDGIAHLHLSADGIAPAFHIAGSVHIDGGSYLGAGIHAVGVNLDARIDADRGKLLITEIVARLSQGGQIEGAVALEPWLPGAKVVPAQITAPGPEESRAGRNVLVRAAVSPIPMNGKVTADFKGVSLDTIFDIVCAPQCRRLGFDARADGPAVATWSNGDVRSIAVSTTLALSPPQQTPAGEAPASGVIDATYTQRNGGVDLRKFALHLPSSDVKAQGALGAYPASSASALAVDFHSHDLSDFDGVLRSLGFNRNGKTGSAALPVALAGQADFHGSWTGSLIKPHLAGTLKAAQLAIEIPSLGEPRLVHLDSADVEGSYSPTQIVFEHATLLHGNSRIVASGTLDASLGAGATTTGRSRSSVAAQPTYDAGSVLHAHADVTNLDVADVQPFLVANPQSLPVTGAFNAQIEASGPLRELGGSGSVEMDRATICGEPVARVRIEGALAHHVLKVSSARAGEAGGDLSASGSYDFNAKTFDLDAHGSGIDIARIAWVGRHNLEAAGKLSVSITGSGSLDDPRLNASATADSLTLGGQKFGVFEVSAHTASHNLAYNATTQLQGADLRLARPDGNEDRLRNPGSPRILPASTLAPSFAWRTLKPSAPAPRSPARSPSMGPLADLKQLRGEANLRQMAVTIAGVPLQSDGAAHATLAGGKIHLDPLHVTGENTDLRAQGSLSLEGAKQLDLAASGSINLKLAESLDPDLTASGVTTFQLEAHGPLQNPGLQGRIDFENGSLSLEDLPNGLSQLHGTLEFNQNRLEVKSLTAMTGGGQLSLGGYLAYQHGIFADLSVTGKGVHIRYPEGVSSLADLTLQLQGPQNNLLLSGDVLITRFAASPDLDLAALAAAGRLLRPNRRAARCPVEPRAPRRAHRLLAAVELPERLRQARRRRGSAPARHPGLAFAPGQRLHHRGQRLDRRNPLRSRARRHHLHQPGPHRAHHRPQRHGAR